MYISQLNNKKECIAQIVGNIVYDNRFVRVMRCFYGSLYEARDTVVCLSYKDESLYEPIIST
jgi:hypothetical protein